MLRNLIRWCPATLGLLLILLTVPCSAQPVLSTTEAMNMTTLRCPTYNRGDDISSRILILPKNQDFAGKTAKGFLYFFAMLYVFLGISIASNIFMLAIEVICSKTRKVYINRDEDGIQVREEKLVRVWNDTVANLTLISLGTSAPEILLSVIETFGNNFCPGALGPGTIVGSASYNLMIITAVCIISIPGEGTKRIKIYKVFMTTSGFAMGAYIWLVIIIQVNTQNKVEIWEAVITLLMFPTLVAVSYWAELNFCLKGKKPEAKSSSLSIYDRSLPMMSDAEAGEPLFHFYNEWDDLLDENGKIKPETVKYLYTELHKIAVLNDHEIATIIATKLIQFKGQSPLWYRIRAIHALVAGQRVFPSLNEKLKEVMDVLNDMTRNETGVRGELRPLEQAPEEFLKKKAVVDFSATCIAIPGFVGQFTAVVRRIGKETVTVFCKVESYDGSAKKNVNYMPISKEFVFEPYMLEQKILLTIIGDKHKNKDSNFFLKLTLTNDNNGLKAVLGPMSVMEVVIMDIEQPGEVQFEKKGIVVSDTASKVELPVERINGADGLLTAKWVAIAGPKCTRLTDVTEGTISFEHGEMKKLLEVPIVSGGRANGADEQFDVEIVEVIGGGGKIGPNKHITVAVSADDGYKLKVNRVCELTEDILAIQTSIPDQSYIHQIKSAFIVNGDKDEAKRASRADVIIHWISLPWKMVFCFLPPPHKLGGWPCFLLTLAMIGLLTTVIGDMATIFGDCLSLDPVTTGVTFVAIGTSLPDTFASRIAALQSPTADAAIGNIMGSNSVNVFLGLGLPWTIASIYAKTNFDEDVQVNASSLAFIVTVYTFCACVAQIVLWLRRNSITFGFSELGGPVGSKWLCGISLIIGWFFYVSMAIMVSQRVEGIVRLSQSLAKSLQIS